MDSLLWITFTNTFWYLNYHEEIYKQLSLFLEEHKGIKVNNIIIPVGANHLPRNKAIFKCFLVLILSSHEHIIEVSSRSELSNSFRFFFVSMIFSNASLITLLSKTTFSEFSCCVMLNVFLLSLWSCNFKLLFSDFNNSVCDF